MSFIIAGLAVTAAGSIYGGLAQRQTRIKMDERRENEERKLNAQREVYQNLDTSNPFLNMENTMEDLTINQQQADFERQSFEQSQSNILEGLKQAAGGSGVAALAQSLASQGQLASQKAAASIGMQERQNEMARAQMAGQIQSQERAGEQYSQQMEMQKQGQLMGLAQQQHNMYQNAALQAEQAGNQMMQQGITQLGGSFTQLGGMKAEQIAVGDTTKAKYKFGNS